MPVECFDGGGYGEASHEGGSTVFCGPGARCEDIAYGDVFDKVWVDVGAGEEGFEGMDKEIGCCSAT